MALLQVPETKRRPSVSHTHSSTRGYLYPSKKEFEVAHSKRPQIRGKCDDWDQQRLRKQTEVNTAAGAESPLTPELPGSQDKNE